jgi:hypothetical protein
MMSRPKKRKYTSPLYHAEKYSGFLPNANKFFGISTGVQAYDQKKMDVTTQ